MIEDTSEINKQPDYLIRCKGELEGPSNFVDIYYQAKQKFL